MKILSHFINNNTPCYGGHSSIQIDHDGRISEGKSSNSLTLKLSNHVGTHMDLPRHFDDKGKNLNEFNLESDWIMKSPQLLVKNFKQDHLILPEDLAELSQETDMLILKSGFEQYRDQKEYYNNNPGFHEKTGHFLRKQFPKLKIVGFDFISITSYQNRPMGRLAHRAFLSSENEGTPIRVIEDMKLSEINETPKEVIISPLMIDQADGIPVTVFAR